MTNRLFDNYKDTLGGQGNHGATNLVSDTIKATLIDTAYDDPDTATDEDYADIAVGARVSTATLASKTFGTVAAGAWDAENYVFSSVTGDQSEEILYWKDSGGESTSILICVFDTFTSGMPVTPNGGDINVTIHSSGIFGF